MRGRWVIVGVTAVLVGVAAGALSLLHRQPSQGSKPAAALAALAPAASNELSLEGKIQAQHVVPVEAQVAGNIESFEAEVGAEVYEGQLLARIANQGLETARESAAQAAESAQAKVNSIESGIIAARLEASRARADASRSRGQFELAEKSYHRQKMLVGEGATPRLTFEKSEREYGLAKNEFESLDEIARQAEGRVTQLMQDLQTAKRSLDEKTSELEAAKVGLAAAEIHSPVNGIVVARHGEAGKPAMGEGQDAAIFRIGVDLNLLEVVLSPEPPVLKQLRAGQPVLIVAAELAGEAIPASITEIKEKEAVVRFTSPSAELKPGMTAQVRIRLN